MSSWDTPSHQDISLTRISPVPGTFLVLGTALGHYTWSPGHPSHQVAPSPQHILAHRCLSPRSRTHLGMTQEQLCCFLKIFQVQLCQDSGQVIIGEEGEGQHGKAPASQEPRPELDQPPRTSKQVNDPREGAWTCGKTGRMSEMGSQQYFPASMVGHPRGTRPSILGVPRLGIPRS